MTGVEIGCCVADAIRGENETKTEDRPFTHCLSFVSLLADKREFTGV